MARRISISIPVEMPWKTPKAEPDPKWTSSYEDRVRALGVENPAAPSDGDVARALNNGLRAAFAGEPTDTSMSAIATFQRCPRSFYYRYVMGLHLKEKPENMRIGSVFHAGMAGGYRHWQEHPCSGADVGWLDAAVLGVRGYIDEHPQLQFEQSQIDLVDDMLALYWQESGRYDNFDEIIRVEESLAWQFGGLTIRNTFDLLARVDGQLTLVDHKTVGGVHESLKFLPLDFQVTTYILAAARTYGEIPRLIYNMVRREVPPGFGHRSTLTKSGKKSTASTDPGDYIRREPIVKSAKALDAFEARLGGLVRNMAHASETEFYQEVPIKTGGGACSNCAYYGPCVAAVEGRLVPDAVLDMTYRRGEDERDAEAAREPAWAGVE